MSITSTLIITNENKTNAQQVIDGLRDIDGLTSLTGDNLFNVELTDGTDSFWCATGWTSLADVTALLNSGYVHHVQLPADLDTAMEATGLTRV